MAAGQQYKAIFDFTSTGDGILSFKVGEQFTLVSKTNENWWLVRSPSGEKGLAPISYLEACPMRNGGPIKSAAYVTVYDYTAQDPSQMSFSKGQTLFLVDKTDVSWWSMQTQAGKQGLVPVNYIDKLDTVPEVAQVNSVPSAEVAQTASVVGAPVNGVGAGASPRGSLSGETGQGMGNHVGNSTSSPGYASPLPQPPESSPEESFQQVLASIDSNIARIHTEATKQGGTYTSQQRETLNKLVLHRQTYISSHKPPPTTVSPNHTPSSQPLQSPPKSPSTSPKKTTLTPHQSPVPKRHAPPPPTSSAKTNGMSSLRRKGSNEDVKRRQTMDASVAAKNRKADNRYSLHISATSDNSGYQPDFGSLPRRRAAPKPPEGGKSSKSSNSQQQQQQQEFYSLHRPKSYGGQINDLPVTTSTFSPSSTPSSPSKPPPPPSSQAPPLSSASPRRMSESGTIKHSPQGSPVKFSKSLSNDSPRLRTSSVGNLRRGSLGQHSGSSSPRSSRGSSKERETFAPPPTTFVVAPPIPSLASSSSSVTKLPTLSSVATTTAMATATTTVTSAPTQPALPTAFDPSVGAELVETVRKTAAITHRKAQVAVGAVLQLVRKQVPQCEQMVDGLFAALEKAMQESSTGISEQHSDLERLKEILFEITECKDDSQQRGWAVHDDEKAISDLLEELLQILCDANPEVSKVAVAEDKYENVLTLITYYQMEARVPIRLLLLKVFGVLCGLDRTVIGILLASVLPNELGRDIQQDMAELQKALYSSTVCTMIFSTAEAVPLSVYDQWDEDYIKFLLDTIEKPPAEDLEEQLPDAFLNMVLSFNQHFPEPESNLVMRALKERPNPRNFSEKLMFVINRGEDPVAISTPCCPDSFTKFLLDVFSDKSTAGMFYTTDMMVLIDIVTRQLTDLCPGMETRTHYLELLYRIVSSTDYRDHLHRQRDLIVCLNRIANEEEEAGQADRELVKKIWMAYPRVFEEVTDL